MKKITRRTAHTAQAENRRFELPLVEGLDIQHEQILEWSTKLNATCYIALCKEAAQQNMKLTEKSTGYNVWRGVDIDNFVSDWTLKNPYQD